MALPDEDRERLRHRFAEYHLTGDPAIRDELVLSHLRLSIHLARRFEHRGIPLDDLTQVASLGLLKAVDRFDPERGLEFSTFATPTIVGELKRHFRDKGWSVRVPRRVQELHGRVNTLVGALTHTLGRSPTITELARAARTSEEEILEAIEAAQAYQASSLDVPGHEGSTMGQLSQDDALLFQVDDKVLVEGLLADLPPREQLMVRLRFFEQMSQSEIAERLGISQMHVSRLLTRCLEQFRDVLTDGRGAGGTG